MSRPKQLAPSTGAQSAEIDAEWLTKLLEKNKVVRSGPSPKPERIATAAKKLSSARFVAEVQSKVRNETGPLYTKATEALHALRETLPLIASEMSEIQNRWHGAAVADHASATKKDLVSMQKIAARLEPALSFFSGKNVKIPAASAWRDIASDLADVYSKMMDGSAIGLTDNSPAPRFVATVIPFVTGETPTVGNVAKHLRDARKLGGRKSGY